MKILFENELMANHRAAQILPAQASFESLQTSTGNAMLFCIGDKNADAKALYLIVEASGVQNGWKAEDITRELSEKYAGHDVKIENFAVTQCHGNGDITIAVTVRVDGSSHLYLLSGMPSKDGSEWMTNASARNWVERPYDGEKAIAKPDIVSIHLTPQLSDAGNHHLLVCTLKDDRGYLDNYVVSFTGDKAWQPFQTSENYDKIISQQIGKANTSLYAGLYQLTELNGGLSLMFTPLKSAFPGPGSVIKLNAPAGAHKIATLPVDDKNNTALYVAADQGIYLFAADQQGPLADGLKIISHPLVTGVQNFYVHQSATETVIWGLNQQGQVFSSRCANASVAVASKWSVPIPILNNVQQIATYVNLQESNSVIFAHVNGQNLVVLTQDPETTLWVKSNVLLPAPDVNAIVEYSTYSTHVQLVKDDNTPLADTELLLTSTSPCNVFVNNVYHFLSPTVPISVVSDVSGQISIVQEIDSLGAICYHLETADKSEKKDVNPMAKVIADISKNADNIPGNAHPEQKAAAKSAIAQFVSVAKEMPQDGSIRKANKTKAMLTAEGGRNFKATEETIWGMSFEDGNWQYHSGEAAMQLFGLEIDHANGVFTMNSSSHQMQDTADDGPLSWAGDIWNWLRSAYESVKRFVVQFAKNVYQCVMDIAGTLYTFALNCVSDVIQGIEFICNKIALFIEDVVKWVGFLFSWNDILVSHDVLKNIIKQYVHYSIEQAPTYKDKIANAFSNVPTLRTDWENSKDPELKKSFGGYSSGSTPLPGQNAPQNNYGSTHLKNGMSTAQSNISQSPGVDDKITTLMSSLKELLEKEVGTMNEAYDDFKDLAQEYDKLSFSEFAIRLLNIVIKFSQNTFSNIVDAVVGILLKLVAGMWDAFETKLDIPVLSPLYRQITGNDLSLLDVVCLVIAIPATLTYKLLLNKEPFPAGASTTILKTGSWTDIQQLLNNEHHPVNRAMVSVSDVDFKSGLIIFTRVSACFSSLVFIVTTRLKAFADESPFSLPALNVMHTMLFYCSTIPNFMAPMYVSTEQKWYVIMSEVIYGITVIQKFGDIFTFYAGDTTGVEKFWKGWAEWTKVIDWLLGLTSAVPVLASSYYNHDKKYKALVTGLTNTFWNANRMMTVFVDNKTPLGNTAFWIKVCSIGAYSVGQFVLVFDELYPFDGDKKENLHRYQLA